MHDRSMTRRSFIRRAAAAGFLTGPAARWLFADVEKRTVRGAVLGDGAPLAGVRVSDGFSVATSDARGGFALDVGPHSGRFLFVTTPRGYWTDAFHVPTAKAAADGSVEFRLASRRQEPRFRFVFWTDIHLEGGGVRIQKFRATVAETNALGPAFVWAQGDIALEGKAGKDYVACVADLRVPLRNGPGNHEMLVAAENPREEFESLFGPTYYSFDWAGVHCVVLDGNTVISKEEVWTSVNGGVSERELAWLAADLAAKPPGVPVIAAIHIPIETTHVRRLSESPKKPAVWMCANGGAVHAILAAHDTKLVLQGHLHENERVLEDGVEYACSAAVAGSWWGSGAGFERGVDNAPRGFRVVEVDGMSIAHRYHSSAESHVDSPGEFARLERDLRPGRRRTLVYNLYDGANAAKVRGRIGEGAWREMPFEPAVRGGVILPHHFGLEVDAAELAPGKRTIEIEATWRGETTRHATEIAVGETGGAVPLIYATDLFHPHVDPDDHFDLATIFALPGIDLRAVILDDGAMQEKRPGIGAVRQLMAIAGRTVPVATGLAPRLKAPDDAAKDQAKPFQAGVELILKTLRESRERVAIAAVGSLRDVAAAYNRDPDLCARKIDRVYIFIGDARSAPGFAFREYNATLDVNAYIAVMRSGLPVYWVPCFDGGPWKNEGRASFWRAPHRALLAGVKDRVKQYFIYALTRKSGVDPVAFLDQPVDRVEWDAVLAGERNLWCCAVFNHIADRKVAEGRQDPFTFERVLVDVDPTGMALYPDDLPYYAVRRFTVTDAAAYAPAMTAATADLLGRLGV